jgi:hypothetical protein
MEEQIKMAKLNAEFSKKQNDLKARKQMVENLKHTRLQHVDEEYHAKKLELLADIADLRKQKEGLALDDTKRLALTDDIRSIEDKLSIIHDERDIEARRVIHEAFTDLMELEEEGSRLNEWLDEEKIKVMEEQHAARLAKEAAQAEKGGDQ